MLQAGATGFEPAISGLTGQHVNRYTTPPNGGYRTTGFDFVKPLDQENKVPH